MPSARPSRASSVFLALGQIRLEEGPVDGDPHELKVLLDQDKLTQGRRGLLVEEGAGGIDLPEVDHADGADKAGEDSHGQEGGEQLGGEAELLEPVHV